MTLIQKPSYNIIEHENRAGGWSFLHIVRRQFQGESNWGEMYMQTVGKEWEWLCYTYELPWNPNPMNAGKSTNYKSCIEFGVYKIKVVDHVSANGRDKGWRLELLNTGHRENIQIHRAYKSMGITGCILPVHTNKIGPTNAKHKLITSDQVIQDNSVNLMHKIKSRWSDLVGGKRDLATLSMQADLPAELSPNDRITGSA